ncbi:hypothetical protein M1B74_05120 [Bacteroides pyogenes]|uniref:hypothetical protein n=1 Tax=Bacteroides pyogenes TaxID=310300 RepID=UPI003B433C06
MKRFIFSLIGCLCLFLNAPAQNGTAGSVFLFKSFQQARVIYKDGRHFSVPLNYNLATSSYVFIDKADGKEKEFSEAEQIAVIQIDDRTFLMRAGKATEIIQAEPEFYVSYTGNIKKRPHQISHGGTTETASVESYSTIAGTGIIGGVRINDGTVSTVNKTYEARIGGKIKQFYNKRSFLKIFPKEKRLLLKTFIEENNINFDSIDEVLKLYRYTIINI